MMATQRPIQPPQWEEQIVPTLKKRLESESAYLSKRLSNSNFSDVHPAPSPQHRTFPEASSLAAPALVASTAPRSRTKSTPLQGSPGRNARPERPGAREAQSKDVLFSTSNQSDNHPGDSSSSSYMAVRSGDAMSSLVTPHSVRRPSLPPNSTPHMPSRIPTRPRSKSTLSSSRPKIPDRSQSTSSGEQIPAVPHHSSPRPSIGFSGPSSIPIHKSRSRSPEKTSQPLPQPPSLPPLSTSSTSAGSSAPQTRLSSELPVGMAPEAYIKNELPPFLMYPDEALRIAERGHDIESFGSFDRTAVANEVVEEMGKRKRAETMKHGPAFGSGFRYGSTSSKRDRVNGLGSQMERHDSATSSGSDGGMAGRMSSELVTSGTQVSRLPRSATTQTVGLGQPSTRRIGTSRKARAVTSAVARSSESSGHPSPLTGSRSVTHGMVTSPSSAPGSRLGVAAHFVPPENSWTPPRGADWDEVVLPAVAKKLGKGETTFEVTERPDEGDLAVEWDKDGVPIKWVKRGQPTNSGTGRVTTPTRPPAGEAPGMGLSTSDFHANSTASGFSPSFEPSPDNPLRPPSPYYSSPSPLRHQRSAEGIELSPIRTSPAQSTNLEPPRSSGAGTGIAGQSESLPAERPLAERTVSRKPSLLRKAPNSTISRQASNMSLRGQYTSTPYTNPRPSPGVSGSGSSIGQTPGTSHLFSEVGYRNVSTTGSGWDTVQKTGAGQVGATARPQTTGPGKSAGAGRNGQKDLDGSHGKGCGCVIM